MKTTQKRSDLFKIFPVASLYIFYCTVLWLHNVFDLSIREYLIKSVVVAQRQWTRFLRVSNQGNDCCLGRDGHFLRFTPYISLDLDCWELLIVT